MSETPAPSPFPSVGPDYPSPAIRPEFSERFSGPTPRRRFQGRRWLHILLFLLTLGTTTVAGGFHYDAFISNFSRTPVTLTIGGLLLRGFWYSGTLLAILGAHEMGHYFLCRRYSVDASLPYFIPAPILLTGTLGAVIKIREAFPTRTVLFDIGIAGPIAGFLVLVPALFIGMSMSTIVPNPTQGSGFELGEPLLFQWATRLVFGAIRDGYTVNMHPMAFAAWFGMLATSLNLLPFGQLDGGHIAYATLGSRISTPISVATVMGAVMMTIISRTWVPMTVMMLAMMLFLGPGHPRIYDYEPLAPGRRALALFALLMLIVCFTPVPLASSDFMGGR